MNSRIEITTEKGYTIAATVFGSTDDRSVLIISSATGVKQGYYHRFATFVATKGITVITFDYLGIGGSLKQPIQQLSNDLADWGKVDLEAVITYAEANYPRLKITLLGHSAGGQLIGLARSSTMVQKIILVAAQSNYWRLWDGQGRLKMWANWYVFPILIDIFGYLPSKKITGMENLPRNVAKQLSRWGRHPNHLFSEISNDDLYFDNISTELVAVSIDDDTFAPIKAVDWLLGKYSNAQRQRIHLTAKKYGVKAIGHFGVFREKFAGNIWPELFDLIV